MEYLVVVVIAVATFLLLFLLLRQLNLWYWRINEIISLLKEIKQLLQGDVSTAGNTSGSPVSSKSSSGDYIVKWKCTKCNTMNHPNLKECFNCGQPRPI